MHASEQWQLRIQGLMELWRSLKFSCICIQNGTRWINLLGRAVLSPDQTAPDGRVSPVVEPDVLLALSGQLPIRALPNLVRNLAADKIFSEEAPYPVRLFPGEDKKGHWYGPQQYDRVFACRDYGVDYPLLVASYFGPSVIELLSSELRDRVDEGLRVTTQPYDGLAGLARAMGLTPIASSGGTTYFRLEAPIPLKFQGVTQDLAKKRLSIKVEVCSTADLDSATVSCIYSVDQSSASLGTLSAWKRSCQGRVALREKGIALTQTKGTLRAVLAYAGTQVELHDHYISSLDAWTRACEFFDPEFALSGELKSARGKISVEALEMGALRFFAILGLRTAWFGKKSVERRPDILACYYRPDGRSTFLVVECTEENPTAKVAKTSLQAESLRNFLESEAATVVPVIFTSGECSPTESQQAASHKVALVGSDESTAILNRFRAGASLEAILSYMEGLSSGNPSQSILYQP